MARLSEARLVGGSVRGFLGAVIIAVWAIGGPASAAEPLRFVTDMQLPFENLSDLEAPGFSTEVVKEVLATLGREASFEEFPWARAVRMAVRGERDALFTALRNDERERCCHFPSEPLLREKWVFFVRAADAGRLKFSSFDDLVGHDIAALRGAAVSPEFWDFVRRHRNISETSSGEASFRMLEAGRVDYAVLSLSEGMGLITSMGLSGQVVPLLSRTLKEGDMYVIFNKERVPSTFVEAFSDALRQFKQTEAFQAIHRKYFRATPY